MDTHSDLTTHQPSASGADEEVTLAQQQDAYRASRSYITPAMQAFAEHWAKNRNQIKAYQFAYPGTTKNHARTNAGRLFRDDRVQAEILRILDRWTDHSAVSLSRVEHELSRLANADIRQLFDAEGNLLTPDQWDADTAAAVASYKETPAKGGGLIRTVRLHDKHAANRTLAEMKGAFQKNKAPPGIQAQFIVNLGGGAQPLGASATVEALPSQEPAIDVSHKRLPARRKTVKQAAPKPPKPKHELF